MKKFKNVFLLAVMAVSAVCVTSCGEDDDKPAGFTIKAVVENGNDYNDKIDEVQVSVEEEKLDNGMGSVMSTLATGKYANGGFTIVLPVVPDKYLKPIKDAVDIWGERKVSDNTAKGILIRNNDFVALKGEKVVGIFLYDPAFLYVDKDVTITGGDWDASLKKGWNIVYYVNAGAYTTTLPSGETYTWSFW